MPQITIQALAGRSVATKRELTRRVTEVVAEVLDVKPDAVTIWIVEGGPENFSKGGVLGTDGSVRDPRGLDDEAPGARS
ncbi:MAG TPA: tautomerase family protein [Candidatus Limnocylindria bacterium]|nr:tautomerase family protein [Candidatus Limnocylindria bacterium]